MELIINIGVFCLGMLFIYITSYVKVKGKNQGLLEDVARLEEEKQKIINDYLIKMEDLKKQHVLEIEKRKFQYEDKRHQFSNFFRALDDFHKRSNEITKQEFHPVIEEFFIKSANGTIEQQQQALNDYLKKVQEFSFKINEEQLKLKTEQRSIWLVASNPLKALLNKLEECVEKANEVNMQMLRVMATPEYLLNNTIINPIQLEIQQQGKSIKEIVTKIQELMSEELNEI